MKKPASNTGRTAAPAKKAAAAPAKKAAPAPAKKSAPPAKKAAPPAKSAAPAKKTAAPAKKAATPVKKTATKAPVKAAPAKATATKSTATASRTSGSTTPTKAAAGKGTANTASRSGNGSAGKTGASASRTATSPARGSAANKSASRKSLSPQERRVRDRNDMDKIFKDVLKDIYYAEKKLTKALGKMSKNATHADLKDAFLTHQEQTEGHVQKVEEAFQLLGIPAKAKRCAAMDGLVEEANEHMEEYEKGAGLDAAMITGAQKVEHYEIAAYGSLRSFAQTLGYNDCAVIFADILAEEKETDALLSTISDTVNEEATREYEDVNGEPSGNASTSPTQNAGAGGNARNGATQASADNKASGSRNTNDSASNGYKTNNEDDTDAEGRYAAPSGDDAETTDMEDSDDDVNDNTETSSAADSITS